ncbi:MAG: DUF58 domain-containing protein [Myxococcales bacterium]|nr:DUF58 domain-containing protein [Myxococcales bacterium]
MSGLSHELLAEIRRIEIVTRRLVNQQMAGQYHSVFKGRGMSFDEVRQYFPGDDPRSIDWNVTARTGEPYVKTYVEERELTVMIMVDMSGSMAFGTVRHEKRRVAAIMAAMMAFSAISNGDRVGLVAFTDRIERYVPPKKGRKHVLRIIDEILRFDPVGAGTDLGAALEFIGRVQRRKAVVFLVSDFLDAGYERPLHVTARRHDLIPLTVIDPRELELPDLGLLLIEDAETGVIEALDTGSRRVRGDFAKKQSQRHAARLADLRRYGVKPIEVSTQADNYAGPLVNYFRIRASRRSLVGESARFQILLRTPESARIRPQSSSS